MAFKALKMALTLILTLNPLQVAYAASAEESYDIPNEGGAPGAVCEPDIHLTLQNDLFMPYNSQTKKYFSTDISASNIGLPPELKKFESSFDFIVVVNKYPGQQRALGYVNGKLTRMMPVSTGSEQLIRKDQFGKGSPRNDTFTQTPTGFHVLKKLEWNHRSGLFPELDPNTGATKLDENGNNVGTAMPFSTFFTPGAASHLLHGDPGQLGVGEGESGGCVRTLDIDAPWIFVQSILAGGPFTELKRGSTIHQTAPVGFGREMTLFDYLRTPPGTYPAGATRAQIDVMNKTTLDRATVNAAVASLNSTTPPMVPHVNTFTGAIDTTRMQPGYKTMFVVISQAPPGEVQQPTKGQLACSGRAPVETSAPPPAATDTSAGPTVALASARIASEGPDVIVNQPSSGMTAPPASAARSIGPDVHVSRSAGPDVRLNRGAGPEVRVNRSTGPDVHVSGATE